MESPIRFSDSVREWLDKGRPVVELESTVVSHGLPRPINLDTAIECEEAINTEGATAATVGIVAGVPKIGLSREELRVFAEGRTPDGATIEKVSLNNLGVVVARKQWGATTIASSIWIATLGGLAAGVAKRPLVFSTGGIGG